MYNNQLPATSPVSSNLACSALRFFTLSLQCSDPKASRRNKAPTKGFRISLRPWPIHIIRNSVDKTKQEPRCGCKPRFKKTWLLTLSAKRDFPALQQIYEKRSI